MVNVQIYISIEIYARSKRVPRQILRMSERYSRQFQPNSMHVATAGGPLYPAARRCWSTAQIQAPLPRRMENRGRITRSNSMRYSVVQSFVINVVYPSSCSTFCCCSAFQRSEAIFGCGEGLSRGMIGSTLFSPEGAVVASCRGVLCVVPMTVYGKPKSWLLEYISDTVNPPSFSPGTSG